MLAALLTVAALARCGPRSGSDRRDRDAREAREQARSEAADVAAGLDPLLAEDAELEAAVRDLEAHVDTQQAKLDGARQALDASRREAASAADRVVGMQIEIGALRGDLMRRAVEAYVTPDDQRIDSLFTSDDVTVAAHKRALLDTVVSNEVDLVDRLRAGEDLLDDLRDEADAAVQRVADEEAVEAEILVELESALAQERRLKAALEARIAEFRVRSMHSRPKRAS